MLVCMIKTKKMQRIENRYNARIGAIKRNYNKQVEQIIKEKGVCPCCGQPLPEQ